MYKRQLLLGFSIVLIAVLTVFGVFPVAERATVLSDKSTQAYNLASQILETHLNRHYSTISVGISEQQEPIQHTTRRGVDVETNFFFKSEITKPYPSREILNILVTVSWTEGSSDEPRPAEVRLQAEKGRLW